MINGYQEQITRIYEKIREEELSAQKGRRQEIEKKLPMAINLEKQIGKLCLDVSLNIFKNIGNREDYLTQLKEKITELRVKKSELLASNGYSIDYLDLHYRCPKCKDTGFIIRERCTCYKHKLVQIYYKNSDLNDLLRINNFDNFQFEFFSSKRSESEPESPRKNMEKNFSKAMSFIKNFDLNYENLLFYGTPGTGKTFLSNCISKELLDKGYLVVYRTSEALIKNLRDIRFNNDEIVEDLLLNCDLLVIDDLGTEQINDFSMTELFNLLNKKILKEKKMLVSTNCRLEEFFKIYSERISSRLLGDFTLCKFFGEDIRIKKNLNRTK